MKYIANLTSDNKTNYEGAVNKNQANIMSFDTARNLLTEFVEARGGKYNDWFFNNKGEMIVGLAVIDASPETIEALEQENVNRLRSKTQKPFLARIEGEHFDVAPLDEVTLFTSNEFKLGCAI